MGKSQLECRKEGNIHYRSGLFERRLRFPPISGFLRHAQVSALTGMMETMGFRHRQVPLACYRLACPIKQIFGCFLAIACSGRVGQWCKLLGHDLLNVGIGSSSILRIKAPTHQVSRQNSCHQDWMDVQWFTQTVNS